MRTLFVSFVLLSAALGCAKEPIAESRTDNSNFRVSLLFSVDGCKVYRFVDGGVYRFLTTCPGSVSHEESCGKHCRREVYTPTAVKR